MRVPQIWQSKGAAVKSRLQYLQPFLAKKPRQPLSACEREVDAIAEREVDTGEKWTPARSGRHFEVVLSADRGKITTKLGFDDTRQTLVRQGSDLVGDGRRVKQVQTKLGFDDARSSSRIPHLLESQHSTMPEMLCVLCVLRCFISASPMKQSEHRSNGEKYTQSHRYKLASDSRTK